MVLRVCPTVKIRMLRDVDVAAQTYAADITVIFRIFLKRADACKHPQILKVLNSCLVARI
eukprot:CAMPEP_0119531742 /NCGR_PEP_ID=MMETSP1344-20130328/45383_1 /TAXON_ID=236787 /ORGANISM="Florenciella parvula, Strain CCMP2471" /LENGTH=59 /DNA_ID=CAMNT_0007572075 /DNA_START=97 /DNA_END=273 /DNA_ORIENTATION=+